MKDDQTVKKPVAIVDPGHYNFMKQMTVLFHRLGDHLHVPSTGSIGGTHSPSGVSQGNFKGNQRKERAMSRRRKMKPSAR